MSNFNILYNDIIRKINNDQIVIEGKMGRLAGSALMGLGMTHGPLVAQQPTDVQKGDISSNVQSSKSNEIDRLYPQVSKKFQERVDLRRKIDKMTALKKKYYDESNYDNVLKVVEMIKEYSAQLDKVNAEIKAMKLSTFLSYDQIVELMTRH
jgi:hypothetical protein